MKLTAFIMLVFCLHLSAKVSSQTVTLSGRNISLEKVFAEIKQQTGFLVFCNYDLMQQAKPVSVKANKMPLEQLLNEVLGEQSLDYTINKTTITITRKKSPASEVEDSKSITSALFVSLIRGRVLDADGVPLAGATVTLKGGKVLGVTNAEGVFSINVSMGDVLIISSVGFESTEYKITSGVVASSDQPSIPGTNISLTITLKRNESKLDEVQIIAYGVTSKRLNTGNVNTVKAKDIETSPVSNPLAALQGRTTGLQITQESGVPGGSFSVRIRGQNSITSGNNPLYIIDGVPFISTSMGFRETSGEILGANGPSPLNTINPFEIESIEILKDADATSIYGSRGTNGVILITTKKGQVGKMKVDFNFYTGAGKVHKMKLLNNSQYLEMRRESYQNDGIPPNIYSAPDLLRWDTTRSTDWQEKLIGGAAQITDAQLSFSGGDVRTQFSIGSGYHKETSVFPGDNAEVRKSAHLNLINTSENQKFKSNISITYSALNSNLLKQDLTGVAITLPPDAPQLYDQSGNLNWENSSWENPLSHLKRQYEANTNTLIGNAVLSYNILPGLEVKTNMGYTNINFKAVTVTPNSSYNPAYASYIPNMSAFSNSSNQSWIVEPQLNWKQKSGEGKFDILVGATFLSQVSEGIAQSGSGFVSEALMKNLKAASTISVATNYNSQYRYNAVFGRINYTLKGKYIINLTGRRDASSRFGPGNQFANFGSVGAAWIFSDEKGVQDIFSFLSYGKVRGSYGITGNDQIGDYGYLDTYASSGPYQGTNGLTPMRLYNPDFGWESSKKFEAAIDLGFVNDRILLSASYYRNRSSNQLVGYSLPPTTGFITIQSNLPATIQNQGIEVELNTINIKNQHLRWNTSLNFTVPRNKLIAYPNLEGSEYANKYVVGEPLNIVKLYHYLGVDPATGVYKLEDVNGDGVLSTPDLQIVRTLGQKYYGGLQNTFQYKGFQLDILFQFVKQSGQSISNYIGIPPGFLSNQPSYVMDRWQKANDASNYQRFTSDFTPATFSFLDWLSSEQSVVDASYIRLKNLSFSYSLPKNLVRKYHIENCQLYVQGQNLFTITNYKGMDPESGGNILPPLQTLTAGIRLTF